MKKIVILSAALFLTLAGCEQKKAADAPAAPAASSAPAAPAASDNAAAPAAAPAAPAGDSTKK